MTIAAYIDGEFLADVATNKGWRDAASYVRNSTDVRAYPNLHHLIEYGWHHFLTEVHNELSKLLVEKPPRSKQVMTTLRGLADKLAGLRIMPDQVIVISDGLS